MGLIPLGPVYIGSLQSCVNFATGFPVLMTLMIIWDSAFLIWEPMPLIKENTKLEEQELNTCEWHIKCNMPNKGRRDSVAYACNPSTLGG